LGEKKYLQKAKRLNTQYLQKPGGGGNQGPGKGNAQKACPISQKHNNFAKLYIKWEEKLFQVRVERLRTDWGENKQH